jgi:hypothetical protein
VSWIQAALGVQRTHESDEGGMAVLTEKHALTLEEIEAQAALELPERESPVTVIVGCLICIGNLTVRLRVEDVNVAAQICAAVDAIQVVVGGSSVDAFSCTVRQQ